MNNKVPFCSICNLVLYRYFNGVKKDMAQFLLDSNVCAGGIESAKACVSNWTTGKNCPDRSTLRKLADLWGMSVGELQNAIELQQITRNNFSDGRPYPLPLKKISLSKEDIQCIKGYPYIFSPGDEMYRTYRNVPLNEHFPAQAHYEEYLKNMKKQLYDTHPQDISYFCFYMQFVPR